MTIGALTQLVVASTTPSPSPSNDGPNAEEVVSATVSTIGVLLGTGLGFVVGLVTAFALQGFLTFIGRRRPVTRTPIRAIAKPIKLLFSVVGMWIAMRLSWPIPAGEAPPALRDGADHVFLILVIVAGTWFVAALVDGIERTALRRMQETGATRYRKAQTQLQIIHRVIMVGIWVLGFALVLMTFDAARAIGATLFTSAGLLSVVIGIAAQSTLGNVFAGLQLAFSDSIRMGDIVIWEKEFTRVEEITLTYVVLKVWDGRRLIVPSSSMTTQTFENWTRRTPDLLGYVDFDLDWSVPIAPMRARLNEILAATDLWDGDTGILQIRDATQSKLLVSVLLSAENSSKLTDLKYFVREQMVRWIQEQVPQAIPHSRALALADSEAEFAIEGVVAAQDAHARIAHAAQQAAKDDEAAKRKRSKKKGAPKNQGPMPVSPGSYVEIGLGKNEFEPPFLGPRTDELDASNSEFEASFPTEDDSAATVIMDVAEIGQFGPARVPVRQRDDLEAQQELAPGAQSAGHESSIFTGSIQAEKRGQEFSGPGAEALSEREKSLERRKAQEAEKERTKDSKKRGSGESESPEKD